MREDPDEVVAIGYGYEFHLISQGWQVGVWKNWDRTVAKLMVSGYPGSAHKGHHSYGSCVKEWQAHCQLGVHLHPVDPNIAQRKGLQAGGSSRPPHCSSSTPACAERPERCPRWEAPGPGESGTSLSGAAVSYTAQEGAWEKYVTTVEKYSSSSADFHFGSCQYHAI
ncbi:hypothetical protein DFH08DRAFT_802376 [Mycena albidolilacea]|uniref:Uncharacterized protein n=1 Tax=Mycena albidolilacea TaxID=1033008 RepID=A0AAD7AHE9_9AGAR|nr:hypothetical protein DFH08DRAFT_802376 [Mycena albidolilacea]